jgi:predicted DNA-binding transcriptional regulator AlpA
MTDLETIKALVERDGMARTVVRLGIAEATIYRWIRTGTTPQQNRIKRAIATARAKLEKAIA